MVIGFDMEVQQLYFVSTVSTDIVSSHTKYCRIAYKDSRMHCKVEMNEWPLDFMAF